jgi:cation diffusion facilitator family transporter
MESSVRLKHERKTMMVVALTAVTMGVEIFFGLRTGSMALLADGIHMGSHVFALGLSWIAYIFVRKTESSSRFTGNSGKILSLSGYSSGLMLLLFAIFILAEAVRRIAEPSPVLYNQAILVAIIGLTVNILSAAILHHKDEQSDHNIKAAYLHVLADALTSITAIIGLTAAMYLKALWIDPAVGILGSFVIIRWSVTLMKESGKVLLDVTKET